MEHNTKCPMCGEPPRPEVLIAKVSRNLYETKPGQDPKLMLLKTLEVVEYRCGGGHTWSDQT